MRPRAVLPQDPLPTEVAGMKISVPRFSPRRLFSSFPPSPLCARHLLRSPRPPGGFQVYTPRLVSPGFSSFKRRPRDFTPPLPLPPHRKTPSEIYARVQPCPRNGAQLLATVTGGISEGWFTIIAGTSRYRPLQRRGGYGARGKCGNIQQLPGIKECVNCEILASADAAPLRCTKRKCNFLRVRIFTCCATSAARLTFFRILFLFFGGGGRFFQRTVLY